jgi:HSP20 family protein
LPELTRRTGRLPSYDPFAEYERLDAKLRWYLERLPGPSSDVVPPADVTESDKSYTVDVDLPGVDKKDIDVTMSGHRLSIRGERKQHKEGERRGVLRRLTRKSGPFGLEITLPGRVDAAATTASLDSGVLSVEVPKEEAERSLRVDVS